MKRTTIPVKITENLFGIEDIPNAILTADWHLREDAPSCRAQEGEFIAAQWQKVQFIAALQKKYKCPIYHAGDLFDYWKPSHSLVSDTLERIPKEFFSIYGNHDLPQHNITLARKCGMNVLYTAGFINILPGVHWLQKDLLHCDIKGRKVLIWHVMTYQGKKLYPGQTDTPASGILRKYTDYDMIVTGHNHQSFVEECDGRLLVNPGSITRQDVGQINFRPRVYLYYAKTNTVQPVYLPIADGVVSTPVNVQQTRERDERIDAFVQKLNTGWDSTINFEENLERFFAANDIETTVRQIISTAIEK